MAQLLVIGAAIGAATVGAGRQIGYSSFGRYLAFWTLVALALAPAWRLARAAGTAAQETRRPKTPPPQAGGRDTAPSLDVALRTAVFAFGLIVLCGLVLGSLGRLSLGGMIAAELVLGATVLLTISSPVAIEMRIRPAWPSVVVGTIGALFVFTLAYGLTHAPFTLYDSISYHLFFAARWVQDRTIGIVPTPFSDEAQAYAPGNGELFFAWLMLPFHGDLFARIGQLPFAAVAAGALYAIGRRLGAVPAHALYPPALFLLARPVMEQAGGANVDLICAAMFLVTMYAGMTAVDRSPERAAPQGSERAAPRWAFWGICFGLFLGTKYLALVYAPVLVALAVARGVRVRMLWAVPGIAAFALPWYLRNWIVAGSPIYPASLTVAGITIARGAFSHAAMLKTVFHTSDVRLLPTMLAHAFGPTLAVASAPLWVAGALRMARRGLWPWGAFAVTPIVMTVLYWFGLPVNIDSRFLLPAVGPALLPIAFLFGASRRWNAALHVVLLLAMAWILIGVPIEIPANVPWFMAGWLALNGLVERQFLWLFGIVAAIVALVWRATAKAPRWAVPATAGVCALSIVTLTAAGERWYAPGGYLNTTPTYVRPGLTDAWHWTDEHIARATVAYTGINLPYPLAGSHLTNRVVYVNTDGRPAWRFHDYDHAYRAHRFDPQPPVLATSSGELMPVPARTGPRDDAPRPRYERMQGIRDAWLDNLRLLHVDYLFVSRLSAYEIDYVWHNGGGFPIEDDWARADPGMFTLVYENLQVRIYRIERGRESVSTPDPSGRA